MTEPTVEQILAHFRDNEAVASSPIPKDLQPAYIRLTNAMADWIDTVRVHERGSYADALDILETLTHLFPEPPRDDSFERLVAGLKGEDVTAAPSTSPASEAVVMAVDIHDTESHKSLPPEVQRLVRELRDDLGLNNEEA